jgi:molybdopterin/thiamine biosynthesis adenylyltransferase
MKMLEYMEAMERQFGMWGGEGQEKLRHAKVAVGGIGGIGAISALMLAKSGIGNIKICDRDAYGVENIVEQAFATYDTAGVEKVTAASQEMKRHNQFANIEGFTGDLSDEAVAMRLIAGVDLLVAGVDNAAARLMLGKVCAKKNIPMVVSANIGWSVLHTVYMPGENHYGSVWKDVEELVWQDGFPNINDPQTRELMQKEWNIWVAALASYEPDYLRKFLVENPSYYWYSSPPAYFGASMGVLDALKILVGRGEVYAFPNIFYFDMKLGLLMTWEDMAKRRAAIRQVWDSGIDEVIRVAQSWYC